MEKHYFETNGFYTCTQECMVLNDGTMIGSVACQSCEFNKEIEETDRYTSPKWIKCSRIKEAVGDEN